MTRRALPFALALLALVRCAPDVPRAEESPLPPAELAALLQRDEPPLLLDVRTPDEFAAGHVPGATHLPVQELAARLDELAAYRARGVVTYCEAGPRAEQAAALLRESGFAEVRVLAGSMRRWREEGREVATGP
jgi:rhodanese-related sulfurtransferase